MTLHFTELATDSEIKKTRVVSRVVLSRPKFKFYRDLMKRVLDTTLIVLASVLVVPLIAVMALFVATDGHNPFYSQSRVGKNNKLFRIWKLRTMVPDADALLASYLDENPQARSEWVETQKLKDDPRITRVGRILRKTSLDELPQLFNVLTGSMALVGPRPMMIQQRSLYPGTSYFNQRPGITGLWQISKRNECGFQARAAFDDAYERDVSLVTDLGILFRTFGVVLRGTGY